MKNKETDDLILRYLDQELTDDEALRFQAQLDEDPSLADRLLLQATILEFLSEPSPVKEVDLAIHPAPKNTTNRLPWSIATIASLVALASLLALFTFRSSRPTPINSDPDLAALLVNEAAAEFAEGLGPDGFRFLPGDYELTAGTAHLRFSSGADFVVSAPARFRIEDSLHVELATGDIRVFAPPSAHGFTIGNGDLELIDYGTEFGVSVNEAADAQDLHVFAGRVDARRRGDDTLLASVLGGEAIRFENGEMNPIANLPTNVFPDVADVAHLHWQSEQSRIIDDPALMFHFPFHITQSERDGSVVPNQAQNGKAGHLMGARTVSGRWPDKGALLFDGISDYLEVDLGTDHRELTVALWVRPDGFDHAINALFDSNGWTEGALHLQIDRSGSLWSGLHNPMTQIRASGSLLTPGRWHHIAVTLSTLDGQYALYIDGQSVAKRVLAPETITISPGLCRIANWAWDGVWKQEPRRNLRCAIDEFSAWSRALTPDEIASQFENGRPSFLLKEWTGQP